MGLTGLNYLLPATFLTKCSFSSFLNFKDYFSDFKQLPYDKKIVIKKLDEILSNNNYKEINQETAKQILLNRDLEKIKNSLQKYEIPEPISLLKTHYEELKKIVENYGLKNNFPPYYIVDNFPEPFHNMSWSCAFFEGEEKEIYGIEPGIYLKKDFIEAFSVSKNFIHEAMHIIIGNYSKEADRKGISRGLEDGICDVFGSLFLMSELTNINIAKNIMVYTKYSGSRENELTKLYRDNVRMALLLYKNFGLDGMVSLIKSGRGKIKEVEELCLEGKYSEIDLKKGNWNKEFDNLSDYFLSMQRSLVVSPLAYYLAENLKEKDSLEDIISKNNLNKDEALKAFKELQERLFLIAINKGIIEYDSSKRYLNVGALRYEN